MKRMLMAMAGAALLGGCAAVRPPDPATPVMPATWYAPPLAHQGSTAALTDWWGQFGDPTLADWMARAQALSPSVGSARAQVFSARASLAGAQAAAGPQVAAVATAVRAPDTTLPLGTTVSAGLQASWEMDLWGGQSAAVRGAQADEAGARAGWHAARVLVAAETAQAYYGYRLCLAQLAVTADDRDSRERTARSSAVTEKAGLTAPAVAALARASHAEGSNRYQQQRAACEGQLKALVALTGLAEPTLRDQVAAAPALPGHDRLQAMLAVNAVPAEVIRQRPDVYQAQQALVAASEAVSVSQAALWPSLSLQGNVLRNRFRGGDLDISVNSWSVGPFTLSLPLLGRQGLQGRAEAAQAHYEAAAQAYAATLSQAVAEVERSLVTLSSLAERVSATQTAVEGYTRSFEATEARYRVGLANLTELEDARRLKLAADSAAVALLQERLGAWITLYVALGGGFDPQAQSEWKAPA